MNHSRKMVLIPAEAVSQSTQTPPYYNKDKKSEKEMDKTHKLLNIILKIAAIQGFDSDFHIFDSMGNPIMNSDVVVLLNNALNTGKELHGENEFIRLLYDAKVDPQWIMNEHVKSKLLNFNPTDDITMNDSSIETKDISTQTVTPFVLRNNISSQTNLVPSFDSGTQTFNSTDTRGTQIENPFKTNFAVTSDGETQLDVHMNTSGTQTQTPFNTGNSETQTLNKVYNDTNTQTDTFRPNKRKIIKPLDRTSFPKFRRLDFDQLIDEQNHSTQNEPMPTEGTEPIRGPSWEIPLPDTDDSNDDF